MSKKPDPEKLARLSEQIQYHRSRQNLPYFKRCIEIVNARKGCLSILDVGGRSAGFLNHVNRNYTQRVMLDVEEIVYLGEPGDYSYFNFDFMDFTILPESYDVVVCLQTIEHVEDKFAFAQKLLKVTRKLLVVSVPYMWHDSKEPVDHDDIDENTISDLFKTGFIYENTRDRRLICQFRK